MDLLKLFLVMIIIVNFSLLGGFSSYLTLASGDPPSNPDSPIPPVHNPSSSIEQSNLTLPVENITTVNPVSPS